MLRYKINLILIYALLVQCRIAFSQETIDPALQGSFTKTINNSLSMLSVEDGSAGEANLLYRYQWINVDGAPQSLWFNGHVGFQDFGASVGIDARQYKIGVEKISEFSGYFNKSVQISNTEYLALGMNFGYLHKEGNYSSLDDQDPSFKQDLSAGAMIYGFSTSLVSPNRYYVGISLPRFIAGNEESNYVQNFGRDYVAYVNGGFLVRMDDALFLKPTALASYRKYTGIEVDVNTMLYFTKVLGIGIGYRQRGDFMASAEFNIKKLRFAYSFQKNIRNSEINQYISNNTHELGISVRFGEKGFSML